MSYLRSLCPLLVCSGAAAMLLTVSPATVAATVTFDALTSPLGGSSASTYEESGLRFASSDAQPTALAHWGANDPRNADTGGATLFQSIPEAELVITRIGGGTFSIDSFDLADLDNAGNAGFIEYVYTDASGHHAGQLLLDELIGLQTFAFAHADLTKLRLFQNAPFFQIDNIRFRIDGDQAVPLPAPWALLGVAGVVGFSLRNCRRRG